MRRTQPRFSGGAVRDALSRGGSCSVWSYEGTGCCIPRLGMALRAVNTGSWNVSLSEHHSSDHIGQPCARRARSVVDEWSGCEHCSDERDEDLDSKQKNEQGMARIARGKCIDRRVFIHHMHKINQSCALCPIRELYPLSCLSALRRSGMICA